MKFPNLNIGRGDDEDLFAHTRMSFGDHIEELRLRMIRAILGFLAALVIGLFVGHWVLDQIQAPVQQQLEEFYDNRIKDLNTQLVKDTQEIESKGNGPFDVRLAKDIVVQQREPTKDWEVPMRKGGARDWEVPMREGAGGEWKTVKLRVASSYLDAPNEQDKDKDRDVEAQLWDGPQGAWRPVTLRAKAQDIAVTDGPVRELDAQMRRGKDGDWTPVTVRITPSDIAAITTWQTLKLRVDPAYLDAPDEADKDKDRDVEAQLWEGPDGAWKPVTLQAKAKDFTATDGPTRELDAKLRMGKDGDWTPVTVRITPGDIAAITTWKTLVQRFNPNAVALDLAKAERKINRPASLTTLTITEAFMTYFLVSIYCGIILSSPWLFWQAWQFIGAGLYPNEKKYVYLYLPLSLTLFLSGAALRKVVLPFGIKYLLSFNEWLGVEPELRLSEWLSFAVMVPLIFGIAFQTPLVMLFLERMGIVEVTLYTKNRKMAYFVLAIAGAILAAAPDALNMMMLTIPLWALYEFGILLCRFAPKAKQELEEPDPEEMVEV